jgi:hypothetical protein
LTRKRYFVASFQREDGKGDPIEARVHVPDGEQVDHAARTDQLAEAVLAAHPDIHRLTYLQAHTEVVYMTAEGEGQSNGQPITQ